MRSRERYFPHFLCDRSADLLTGAATGKEAESETSFVAPFIGAACYGPHFVMAATSSKVTDSRRS